MAPPLTNDPDFDILAWHPAYSSCQRYFLDHAQHEPATQALCALIINGQGDCFDDSIAYCGACSGDGSATESRFW